jgi:hypothetical protein
VARVPDSSLLHLLGKASLFALFSLPREDLEEQELGSIAAGPLFYVLTNSIGGGDQVTMTGHVLAYVHSHIFFSPPITYIFKGPILSPRSEKAITLSSYILEGCTIYFFKSLPGATW